MYIAYAKAVSLDGYPVQYLVSYDNSVTNDIENAMVFDTEREFKAWKKSTEALSWKGFDFELVAL